MCHYVWIRVQSNIHAVRDLGVTFDSELTMRRHVNTVTRACFHHIRRLKQIRRLLGKDVADGLVSAFILSRLDYCNAVLAGLPKSIAPLQRVQNAAARLLARLGPRDHVTSTIRDLHLLPVQYRITYKLCLVMHLVNTGRAPITYLINSVTATRDVVSRSRLRSSSSHRYEQPRTRHKLGERRFTFAGPAVWNSTTIAT